MSTARAGPPRWSRRIAIFGLLLATAAALGSLLAVLEIGLVDCEQPPRPGAPRGDLCDAPYQLLVIPPPTLVIAGAVLSWRRRSYVWLIACSVAAVAVIGLFFELPDLFPTY